MGVVLSMCRRWANRAGVVLAWTVLAAHAQEPAAAPPPVEMFFTAGPLRGATLSPSGRWLGVLSAIPGRRVGFLIVDVSGAEPAKFIEASDNDDVSGFNWVGDDWLVFSVSDARDARNARLGGGLMATRRDGTESWQIISRGYGGLLAIGAPGTNEIIVADGHSNASYEYTHTTLRALNIVTRKSRIVQDEAPRAQSWWFDKTGRARAAQHRDDGQVVTWWEGSDGTWRAIDKSPYLEWKLIPNFIDGDGRLVVNTYSPDGSLELRHFDEAKGQPGAEVLLTTPGYDSAVSVIRGPAPARRTLGFRFVTDAPGTVWLSDEMQAIQDTVDARFPGRINTVHCSPCEAPEAVVVTSYADVDPGELLLFRPKRNQWQLLGQLHPEVNPSRMARMSFHRPTARDGRTLPLWITGAPPAGAKPRPAVVLVHGGPHVRGTQWGWHGDAQFLASRGYVVIEPEFRGSRGYGQAHFRAGWKEWGGAMIDDLTDALRFAAAQGWADMGRTCIVGSSYGGYAVLMSLAKEPELYRCGVAHAADSDLRHNFSFHWSDASRDTLTDYFPKVMGDPKKDAALLEAASPLRHAARIRADLLLIYGEVDYRVPVENGERMRDALKKLGRPVEWVLYDEEGHGFTRRSNLIDFWRRIETFLARHLQ